MCNNNGKKEKGEKAKQVTKKVENENFLNMLVCSLALPLTPFPFGLPLSLSLSHSLPPPLRIFLSRFGQLQQNKLQIKN